MTKLFDKPCSVTMYGMRFQVLSDGRDRGLWFKLVDDKRNPNVDESTLIEWDELKKLQLLINNQMNKRKGQR